MASLLVQTKLYIPKLRRSLVARPRLSGRLRRGAESRLLLISAPAGFGKTTLLAEWLAAPLSGRWPGCHWRRATASPRRTGPM
jgi:LuxR family maltose regulon positive regulatory protein